MLTNRNVYLLPLMLLSIRKLRKMASFRGKLPAKPRSNFAAFTAGGILYLWTVAEKSLARLNLFPGENEK